MAAVVAMVVEARAVKALATAEVKARRGGGDAGGGCGARRDRGGKRRALRRAPEGIITEKKGLHADLDVTGFGDVTGEFFNVTRENLIQLHQRFAYVARPRSSLSVTQSVTQANEPIWWPLPPLVRLYFWWNVIACRPRRFRRAEAGARAAKSARPKMN